tara:strand:- start:240 stop:416 length:177 start_codon:yes stop_codon:yes gene_type:complete
MQTLLSNKWTSLLCTLINSSFAFAALNGGSLVLAGFCSLMALYCGRNFITGMKEDYYD